MVQRVDVPLVCDVVCVYSCKGVLVSRYYCVVLSCIVVWEIVGTYPPLSPGAKANVGNHAITPLVDSAHIMYKLKSAIRNKVRLISCMHGWLAPLLFTYIR